MIPVCPCVLSITDNSERYNLSLAGFHPGVRHLGVFSLPSALFMLQFMCLIELQIKLVFHGNLIPGNHKHNIFISLVIIPSVHDEQSIIVVRILSCTQLATVVSSLPSFSSQKHVCGTSSM